jgi:hypothetical protein
MYMLAPQIVATYYAIITIVIICNNNAYISFSVNATIYFSFVISFIIIIMSK